MRFGFWLDTSNSFEHMQHVCRLAEAAGWDGIWAPDHFMPPPEGYPMKTGYPDDDPELDSVNEAWVLMAALAATVPRVRLGHLVLGNTYRHPAVTAKMAATIDRISGGRFVLGLGAAWQENEHRRYGIRYGTAGERADRLEEACEIITGMFANKRTDFAGRYYRLDGAPLAPKPVGHLPLMIGGAGERRTIPTTARFADEWNTWGGPEKLIQKMAVLDRACEAIGRDPAAVQRSAALLVGLRDVPATPAERAQGLARAHPLLVGTAAQITETLAEYDAAGVDEIIIPDFNWTAEETPDRLHRIATEVIPNFC
ncbi:MAG: TIGR03560 family F420-dependent LLM class oxidoreductase [bacterium]|nr:TIGR03560 family F420-dependent LLM class oxidoreductase [bacterium]